MGKDDNLVNTEFTKHYDLLIHYSEKQFKYTQQFISLTLAIWGGYFYLLLNKTKDCPHCKCSSTIDVVSLPTLALWIAVLIGIIYLALLISNRHYFAVTLNRLKFIRENFLFDGNENIWSNYPEYHRGSVNSGNKEDIKLMRPLSSFGVTVVFVCMAICLAFWRIPMPCLQNCLFGYSFIMPVLLFLIINVLLFCVVNHRYNCMSKKRDANKPNTNKSQ